MKHDAAAQPNIPMPSRFLASPLAAILLLALAVGAIGGLYLKRGWAASRQAVEASLTSISDLKTRQISAWYKSYQSDAQALSRDPIIRVRLRQILSAPAGTRPTRDMQAWIENEQESQGYRQLVLYDARGVPVLYAPAGAPASSDPPLGGSPDFQAALRGEGVLAIDLRCAFADSTRFRLGFWVPVMDPSGANTPTLGVLLLEVDPDQALFPLIQSWPTPSRTAETLLIRRDGNEIVYLNRLRHSNNTPLAMRVPLGRAGSLPAAMAVRGQEGIVDGLDYRGVSVVAAVGAVPGTPWFIVAKQDRGEVEGPLRRQVLATVLVFILLFLAASLGIGHLWRQRDIRLLQQQIATEQERRRLEETLQGQQEFARTLLEHLSAGVVACDADGKLTLFNRAARDWHGSDAMEAPPEEWARYYDLFLEDGVTPMTMETIPLARAFRGETVRDAGMVICAKGQHPRQIIAHAAPLHEIGGQPLGAVAVMHDITEQRRAEDALKHTAEVLRQSNEEVRQFAYIVSHDLRSPLVNMQGFATELRRTLADLDPLVQSAVEKLGREERASADRMLRRDIPDALGFIDSAVVRMDHLVASLLRLSRLGHHELVPEKLDLGRMVSDILVIMNAQIEEYGVTVTVRPLPEVTADRAFLEQILSNILGNAVMYGDRSRPGRIEVEGKLTGSDLVMNISDNGRGIAEDDFGKVFAPFRRAGATGVPGEGMGMAYVQAMVRRHGGRIWFESQLGVGTTFSFVLPVVRS